MEFFWKEYLSLLHLFIYLIIYSYEYGLIYIYFIVGVIIQYYHYLFCCSDCSSFSHWELFRVGSCLFLTSLWGHFDPPLSPLSLWQTNHEPIRFFKISNIYLFKIFPNISSVNILLQILLNLFQHHCSGNPALLLKQSSEN